MTGTVTEVNNSSHLSASGSKVDATDVVYVDTAANLKTAILNGDLHGGGNRVDIVVADTQSSIDSSGILSINLSDEGYSGSNITTSLAEKFPNPFIVDAVNKFNDSKVVDYQLDSSLVGAVITDPLTVEEFLALTSDNITGGAINSAAIADTAANIMQLDPQSIVDSNGDPDPTSPLLKITGLSATDATVDQIIALDAATDFVNANNGATADIGLSYTFASTELFSDIIVDGAELALSANATNSPSPGTISIADSADTILDSAALFGAGGVLPGYYPSLLLTLIWTNWLT